MLGYKGLTNPYHVLTTARTKPNGSSESTVRMLVRLPISTNVGQPIDQLPNDYQTLPGFTILLTNRVHGILFQIVHRPIPFERWAMALYGKAKQLF